MSAGRARLWTLGPATLGMLLYAVTLAGTYVYDDASVIAMDPRVSDPSLWGRFFTETYNAGVDNLWRPLTSLSFALQAQLHGVGDGAALFFHAVNVLLYGGVIWLVTRLAVRLTDVRVGGVVGLLFAAQPVHVEAVAGLVGRSELLCGVGMFGALLLATSDRPLTWRRCLAISGLTFLSIGAKEQGLVTSALLLAWFVLRRWLAPTLTASPTPAEAVELDYATPVRTSTGGQRLTLCLVLPLAVYLFYREQVFPFGWPRNLLDESIQPLILADGRDRWLIPLALLGRATQLLLAPWALSLDYGLNVTTPTQSLADPYLWLGAATLLAWFLGFGIALARRHLIEAFALLGLALTYLPASNGPTVIGTIFGERLLFLPSAFFVLYLALLARRLPKGWAKALLAVALVAGSGQTLRYALLWTDSLALYEHQARVRPDSVRSWMLLADGYRQIGDLDRAADAARRGTEVAPGYWSNWMQRADIEADRGRWNDARRFATRAFDNKPITVTAGLRTEIRKRAIEAQRRDEAATQPAARPAD